MDPSIQFCALPIFYGMRPELTMVYSDIKIER